MTTFSYLNISDEISENAEQPFTKFFTSWEEAFYIKALKKAPVGKLITFNLGIEQARADVHLDLSERFGHISLKQ